jgi:hypothetical protein
VRRVIFVKAPSDKVPHRYAGSIGVLHDPRKEGMNEGMKKSIKEGVKEEKERKG